MRLLTMERISPMHLRNYHCTRKREIVALKFWALECTQAQIGMSFENFRTETQKILLHPNATEALAPRLQILEEPKRNTEARKLIAIVERKSLTLTIIKIRRIGRQTSFRPQNPPYTSEHAFENLILERSRKRNSTPIGIISSHHM